jgi:hypothetical protein
LRAEYPRATIEALVPSERPSPYGEYAPLIRVEAPGSVIVEGRVGERALSPDSIGELRVRNRARGAATGALIGLVAGSATAVGAFYADTRGCTFECQGRGTGMVAVGVLFGALGALLGLGFGSAFVPTTTVRFGDLPPPNE